MASRSSFPLVDTKTGGRSFLFTSESTSEGHPDKLADLISGTMLEMKYRILIEHFTGKTVHSALRNYHVKVFFRESDRHLYQEIIHGSVKTVNERCRRAQKMNFTNALVTMKQRLVVLFTLCKNLLDEAVTQISGHRLLG